MNRAEKIALAKELKQEFAQAQVAVFADYKGLSAPQADELRRRLRTAGSRVLVLKNNVARWVFEDGSLGEEGKTLMDAVVGPTLVAFSTKEISLAAKLMHQFAQENQAFKLKDSLMGRKRLAVSEIETLAKLPSQDVLRGLLLGTLQTPMRNWVSVLAAVPRSLVTVLAAIGRKKASTP